VHGQIKGYRQGCSGLPCTETRSASISRFPDRQPCWDVPLEYISQSGQRATTIPQAGLGNVDGPVSPWSHEGCTLLGATGWSVIHEGFQGTKQTLSHLSQKDTYKLGTLVGKVYELKPANYSQEAHRAAGRPCAARDCKWLLSHAIHRRLLLFFLSSLPSPHYSNHSMSSVPLLFWSDLILALCPSLPIPNQKTHSALSRARLTKAALNRSRQ